MNTIFDIETGPLPDDQLARVMPEFTAPSNYKDPAKIEQYIAESRSLWKQNAALSALTGRVLAIGLRKGGESTVCGADHEGELLTWFWDKGEESTVCGVHHEGDLLTWFWDKWRTASEKEGSFRFIGFCCKSFDLPFLVQRSWVNSVPIPLDLFYGRYFSDRVIDLQERWLCFGRDSKGCSLDAIARALGVGQKSGTGKEFATLWYTNRDLAIAYLKDDLAITSAIATRMGL